MLENVEPARTLLIQFAKWPQLGRVKTRLANTIGENAALDAHVQLTHSVLNTLAQTGWPIQFWWDRALQVPPPEAVPLINAIESVGGEQRHQWGNSLGERMLLALSANRPQYGRVIIVGSDCPSIDVNYLRQAEQLLEHHDVVLGPAEDGGYVLFGARRTRAGMFDGVKWGTSQVLADTEVALQKCGLSFARLPQRWDVDEAADWDRFLSQAMPSH